MNSPTPLFIVGHKRSGSSQLRRILNMHKKVLIGPETDITWILYQYFNNLDLECYPYDGPEGMNRTLQRKHQLINASKKPYDIFKRVIKSSIGRKSKLTQPFRTLGLKYIGDQKPFQNIDPKIVQFTFEHFPTPCYIHLIRHPENVISSCMSFGENNDGGWMWKGLSPKEILDRWVQVENWVLEEKRKSRHTIIDVRYEDLIHMPKKVMSEVFNNLKLQYNSHLLEKIKNSIQLPSKNQTLNINYSQDALAIMQQFNYLPK